MVFRYFTRQAAKKSHQFYFKLILCVLCTFILFILWRRWTPPKCNIVFSKEREMSEVGWRHTGCPNIGGGPLGVVITARASENLSENIWAYLSVMSVANKYNNWPAVPRDLIEKLHLGGFMSLKVTSLEDLSNRCSLTRLLEEYPKAEITYKNKNILKAMEYEETKNITLIVLPNFADEKEVLIYNWFQFSSMLEFKEELVAHSYKLIEMELTNQKISFAEAPSTQYVGVLITLADDDNEKLAGLYRRAMSEMRRRLTPREVVFVVVSEDPEWCRQYFQASDVIVTDHESPARDLSLLAACNHTIIPPTSFGLAAAIFNPNGMTIVRDSVKIEQEFITIINYFAKHLHNWIMMNLKNYDQKYLV